MTRKADRPTGRDRIDSDLPGGIDRRDVLQLAAGAGAGVLVPGGLLGSTLSGPAHAAIPGPVYAPLKVEMATVDNPSLPLRTYNGKTPGPTLKVQAGGQLRVQLENALAPNPAGDPGNCLVGDDMNEFHGRNTTNLHTHGLHISPTLDASRTYDSDNIFLAVLPESEVVGCQKDTFRRHKVEYVFDIVPDHPPGTHWYHAHKHGSTAQQVVNGLAGPLIVEDPASGPLAMPSYIANAPEKIFMIQMRDLETDETNGGGKGKLKLVLTNADGNGGGDKDPHITLNPGAVERWRIINASPSSEAFLKLSLDTNQIELWQIAFDGLTLNRRWEINQSGGNPWENAAALAPGNRMDLMIRVPTVIPPGRYRLSATPHTDSVMQDGAFLASDPVSLTVEIAGPPIRAEWSDSDELPGPGFDDITNRELTDPVTGKKREKSAVFYLDLNDPDNIKAMIDGERFDGEVKKTMHLDTAEEWTVSNKNPFTHPFHIHVNPFFVTHINDVPLDVGNALRRWQDTIALPGVRDDGFPGSVTFRTRFTDFVGKFVIHCHILNHEDRGMMQVVEVVEA